MAIGPIVFWGYVALLVTGGVMGWVKARSKASIIASGTIAVVLVAVRLAGAPTLVLVGLLAFLGLYFGSSYAKSRKLMPGGVFCVLSLAAAAALYFLGA